MSLKYDQKIQKKKLKAMSKEKEQTKHNQKYQ